MSIALEHNVQPKPGGDPWLAVATSVAAAGRKVAEPDASRQASGLRGNGEPHVRRPSSTADRTLLECGCLRTAGGDVLSHCPPHWMELGEAERARLGRAARARRDTT